MKSWGRCRCRSHGKPSTLTRQDKERKEKGEKPQGEILDPHGDALDVKQGAYGDVLDVASKRRQLGCQKAALEAVRARRCTRRGA